MALRESFHETGLSFLLSRVAGDGIIGVEAEEAGAEYAEGGIEEFGGGGDVELLLPVPFSLCDGVSDQRPHGIVRRRGWLSWSAAGDSWWGCCEG